MIDQPQGEKPALTVVIQSWWTPALAVIMLVVGLLAGYFGRPLLNKGSDSTGSVAAITTPVTTNAPVGLAAIPTATVDPTIAAISSTEQLMAYLVSQATHIQGDSNANVTLIEFSDYQ
jgi:hypothetical protein